MAIHETRGVHPCEFCPDWNNNQFRASRNREIVSMGYSEIRVIGPSGQSYAAPSLIYHYVSAHHYRPPDSFVHALRSGPRPPSEGYFDALRTRELRWGSTLR